MIPCKDCITYAICRSRMIDCLPEGEHDKPEGVAFIIALAFYRYLSVKCCLIKKYIDIELDVADAGLNNTEHDQLICKILWEALDL